MHNKTGNPTCRRNPVHARTLRSRGSKRLGAAVAELAFCLPVFTVVTFGFIDVTNYIYFKQTLKVAAYEGIRAAADVGAVSADVTGAVDRMLTAREIEGWTLTPPANLTTARRGDLLQLELKVPISELAHFSSFNLLADRNVTVSVVAVKE
ncbi:TadE-like protein [Rosistilla carotiformis]|uniref:TadE-like protein n=1 Tax=Rosistilla carotiformis TaxID=2528017 RepID=A0A518JTR5_9BACT|nr:TadE family protein [Rosistilla carotiformis]QDV68933.1 TadE-like protein [Rosistilla carotiformis]